MPRTTEAEDCEIADVLEMLAVQPELMNAEMVGGLRIGRRRMQNATQAAPTACADADSNHSEASQGICVSGKESKGPKSRTLPGSAVDRVLRSMDTHRRACKTTAASRCFTHRTPHRKSAPNKQTSKRLSLFSKAPQHKALST